MKRTVKAWVQVFPSGHLLASSRPKKWFDAGRPVGAPRLLRGSITIDDDGKPARRKRTGGAR